MKWCVAVCTQIKLSFLNNGLKRNYHMLLKKSEFEKTKKSSIPLFPSLYYQRNQTIMKTLVSRLSAPQSRREARRGDCAVEGGTSFVNRFIG